jgi:hypothetical protein
VKLTAKRTSVSHAEFALNSEGLVELELVPVTPAGVVPRACREMSESRLSRNLSRDNIGLVCGAERDVVALGASRL